MGGKYYGANTTINVWTPATYGTGFSLAQVWLVSGQHENVNTMEAGWIVSSSTSNNSLNNNLK